MDQIHIIRHKVLGRQAIARSLTLSHVAPHRTRRYAEAKLEAQFCSNPLFAPCRIRTSHRRNQLLDIHR